MADDSKKGTIITNLDTIPVIQNNVGAGAAGPLRNVQDFITVAAAASAATLYRLVRVPTNAKVKQVYLESEAQGAGAFNVSVYYSDSTQDGTPPAKQGLIVPTTGDQFFASDVSAASAIRSDVTNESGNYPLSKRNQPLWQALGLTSDPGGNFDICAVVHTTAVTTGTGRLGVEVNFVE